MVDGDIDFCLTGSVILCKPRKEYGAEFFVLRPERKALANASMV